MTFLRTALVFFILSVFTFNVAAQEFDLQKFLDKAQKATDQYRETFKNLIAEELKTYEYYKKDGTLDDRRTIKSMFIVYPSAKGDSVLEYRNVIEFNGKNVARSEDDIVNFFEKLVKSDSGGQEWRRLRNEGNRFEGKSSAYGLTLGQAWALQPYYREFFDFKVAGREKIGGRDVIVVEYQQTKYTGRIVANATEEESKAERAGVSFDTFLSNRFRPTNPRLRGKFWLDAETAQLWRDEFEMTIQPAILTKRMVSGEFKNEYQPSEFGILLPKKLWMMTYRFEGKDEATMSRTKAGMKSFEYSKFRRADSEVKEVKTGN